MKAKTFILLLFLTITPYLISCPPATDHYTFKIEGVNSMATAKQVIAKLQDDFLLLPVFNSIDSSFKVPSTQYLNEKELNDYLIQYGYTLTEFNLPTP